MSCCMKLFKSAKSFDLPGPGTILKTDTNQRESFASKGDPDETKITNGVTLSSKGIQKKSVAPHRPKTLALENVPKSPPPKFELPDFTKSKITQSLSEKIRRTKVKQCTKQKRSASTPGLDTNLESLPASSNEEHSTTNHNVEIQKQHIVVPSIVSHKNPSPQAPKTRKPYCQQTLTAYAEIDSLAGSNENINSPSPTTQSGQKKFVRHGTITEGEKTPTTNGGSARKASIDVIGKTSRPDDDTMRPKLDSGIGSDVMDDAEKIGLSPRGSDELDDDLKDRPSELNPPMPLQANVRKEGVISEPIEEKKELSIELFDKDSATETMIAKAIAVNDFLNNMMDKERLSVVVKAMIPKEYPANSFIIKEGENGNHFFVSAEGEFEVVKDGEVKKTFGPGVVFGELAILYKAKRFASIRATTNSKVWSLERKVFQKIMMRTGCQEREQNVAFLTSIDALKGLSVDVLHKIGDLLKREFYETGSTIIRQGDPGDKFYIIRGGRVTIMKRDDKGENRIVRILKRGDCFGEQAIINQETRLASVIAQEPGTECLTLDRLAFNNYLGRISELKKKPVDQPIEIPPKINVINPAYEHIKLDDLDIIGTLGIGGFGRVELAQYQKKETFALKKLKKQEVVNQGQIQHAYCEKEIMSVCDSPFIVKLYKTYKNKKYIYFLMEPCLGGDVWTQLQRLKSFDDKTAKFVTGCVVEAFEYLHTRNIIYRDLKPENLMLDSEGYVKLVDFGFAKRINPNNKTWTFSGTPEYVAPEIILNKGHDRAVDYWALGVFIHELLVGKPPFRGKDHMRTYNAILRGIDVAPMSTRIPKSAQGLIKGLCRQIPTDRLGYQKKGINEIKKHRLHRRAMTAPLKRPIRSKTDLSNFEEYPAHLERDDPPDETSGWDINF